MYGGGGLGSFILIFVAMFYLYPYLNPDAEQQVDKQSSKMEQAQFDPDRFGPEAVEKLKVRIEDFQETVDSLRQLESQYVSQIDSLEGHISQIEQQKQEIEAQKAKEITTKDLEEVSKSLLNLDEDALMPIVNLLEEEQLIGLYNSASNMQRAKLLRSLKPDKAASILKKVMQ